MQLLFLHRVAQIHVFLAKRCCGRRGMKPIDSVFMRFAMHAQLVFNFCWLRVHLLDNEDSKKDWFKKAPIHIANHQCYLDTMCFDCSVAGGTRYVGRGEMKRIPVLGPLFRDMDTVFVIRENKEDRQAALRSIQVRVHSGRA